jgi:hypothetical protein
VFGLPTGDIRLILYAYNGRGHFYQALWFTGHLVGVVAGGIWDLGMGWIRKDPVLGFQSGSGGESAGINGDCIGGICSLSGGLSQAALAGGK